MPVSIHVVHHRVDLVQISADSTHTQTQTQTHTLCVRTIGCKYKKKGNGVDMRTEIGRFHYQNSFTLLLLQN